MGEKHKCKPLTVSVLQKSNWLEASRDGKRWQITEINQPWERPDDHISVWYVLIIYLILWDDLYITIYDL